MRPYFLLFATFCSSINNQAYMAVRLAAAAYCKPPHTNVSLSGLVEIHNPVSDLEGFVCAVPALKTIYVVLRGSVSVRNWVEDLEMVQSDYDLCTAGSTQRVCNGCKVHHGFYHSALGVQPQINAAIAKFDASYDVVFTGHSYGAATAVIAATCRPGSSVITFGEPRIGNAAFAAYVDDILDVQRYTHDKDIVPHLPPASAGYRHHGREFFETNASHIHPCIADIEDKSCAEQYIIEQTTVADHMVYLGVKMGTEGCVS